MQFDINIRVLQIIVHKGPAGSGVPGRESFMMRHPKAE